ncbi:42146_t:CDS:2 [Gigaspora margarita]|uniref:42146_t:CDS:1 n=1 Tax=Gigaspora margarita TaxID=4874 RepID=A0ABN7UXR8_GIGMA|nr:42146_t:CDS:2 [Gigaspora margarita]
MESNTLSISETQYEHNNSLERERYAKCISRTIEETADTGPSETQRRASETTKEAEHQLHRKNWNKANNRASNATRLENYNTNAIIPYNFGHMNLECPKFQLPAITSPLTILHTLLVEENEQARAFRKKSACAKIDKRVIGQ